MALQRDILAAGNSAESSKAFVGHVLDDLTALGTVQTDALEILRPICVFTTVAAGSGARLPWTPNKGDQIVISNKGANDLTVYPPVDGTIDGAAVNVPFTIPVGKSVIFWCTDALTWIILAQLPIPAPTPPFDLKVDDEGVQVGSGIDELDFVGAGVTATAVGTKATITIPGGAAGCPTDLPPIVLQFGQQIANDPNKVLQYDISTPGAAFLRVIDAADLGTGTVTYAPKADDRSAIWNARDDKMYFLATKTDSVGPVVTEVLVQFDPRTLLISGEMVLPASWTVGNSVLVDVADERAWIQSGFDTTLRAFDTVSFTEKFNDGGALAPLALTENASIACNSGQLLTDDATDPVVVHLITVTGATSFTDTAITIPGALGNQATFANNGSYRRRWIMDRNKVVLCYSGLGAPGVRWTLLDLNDLTFQEERTVNAPENNGTYWDPYAQRLIASVNSSIGDFGTFISDDTGGVLGVAALNNGDWSSGPVFTLGGLAWVQSLTFLGYGGFNEDVPATTPDETYETTSFISAGGNAWVSGNECIALRRKDCLPITAPQRGGLQWQAPVFRSYVPFSEGSSGQTITDTPAALEYFNSVDTAGWFDVAVGNPGGSFYTPQVRGYYGVEAGISARGSTGTSTMFFQVTSPTTPGACANLNAVDAISFWSDSISDIVHCDGDTDTISITCQAFTGTTWDPGVSSPFDPNGCCYFNIWLLKAD